MVREERAYPHTQGRWEAKVSSTPNSMFDMYVVKETLDVKQKDGTGVACLNGTLNCVDEGESCISSIAIIA